MKTHLIITMEKLRNSWQPFWTILQISKRNNLKEMIKNWEGLAQLWLKEQKFWAKTWKKVQKRLQIWSNMLQKSKKTRFNLWNMMSKSVQCWKHQWKVRYWQICSIALTRGAFMINDFLRNPHFRQDFINPFSLRC